MLVVPGLLGSVLDAGSGPKRWEKGRPIEWIKVNDVADFVYFDHSRHLKAGIACQECHGDVAAMPADIRDRILQVWHPDPLLCQQCRQQMRVITVID